VKHAETKLEGYAMPATPDVRPVGDLPNEIGKTAARELSFNGITSLKQVAEHSKKELLAIHGVGPKAIAILGEALAAKGMDYKQP
jgi:predicted flap endonuclease-1-like 5' DNA nuclease